MKKKNPIKQRTTEQYKMENYLRGFKKEGKWIQKFISQPDESYMNWIKQEAVPMVKEVIKTMRIRGLIISNGQIAAENPSYNSWYKDHSVDSELRTLDGIVSYEDVIRTDIYTEYNRVQVKIPCLIKNANKYEEDGFLDCEIFIIKDNAPMYRVHFNIYTVTVS